MCDKWTSPDQYKDLYTIYPDLAPRKLIIQISQDIIKNGSSQAFTPMSEGIRSIYEANRVIGFLDDTLVDSNPEYVYTRIIGLPKKCLIIKGRYLVKSGEAAGLEREILVVEDEEYKRAANFLGALAHSHASGPVIIPKSKVTTLEDDLFANVYEICCTSSNCPPYKESIPKTIAKIATLLHGQGLNAFGYKSFRDYCRKYNVVVKIIGMVYASHHCLTRMDRYRDGQKRHRFYADVVSLYTQEGALNLLSKKDDNMLLAVLLFELAISVAIVNPTMYLAIIHYLSIEKNTLKYKNEDLITNEIDKDLESGFYYPYYPIRNLALHITGKINFYDHDLNWKILKEKNTPHVHLIYEKLNELNISNPINGNLKEEKESELINSGFTNLKQLLNKFDVDEFIFFKQINNKEATYIVQSLIFPQRNYSHGYLPLYDNQLSITLDHLSKILEGCDVKLDIHFPPRLYENAVKIKYDKYKSLIKQGKIHALVQQYESYRINNWPDTDFSIYEVNYVTFSFLELLWNAKYKDAIDKKSGYYPDRITRWQFEQIINEGVK